MGLKHLHIQSGKLNIAEYDYASAWFDQSKISFVIEKFIANAIDHAEPETNITLLISLNHEYWEIKTAHPENDKLTKIYKTNRHWLHRYKTELECKSAKDLFTISSSDKFSLLNLSLTDFKTISP